MIANAHSLLPDRPLTDPRRLRQFLRWNLAEHPVQQIEPLIAVLLLHCIPIVNDLILHIFWEIRLLAMVLNPDPNTCPRSQYVRGSCDQMQLQKRTP